jgi:hypothetical protein
LPVSVFSSSIFRLIHSLCLSISIFVFYNFIYFYICRYLFSSLSFPFLYLFLCFPFTLQFLISFVSVFLTQNCTLLHLKIQLLGLCR